MKNSSSEVRLKNMLHQAKLESSLIESQINTEEEKIRRLKSHSLSLSIITSDLVKKSKDYKLLELQLIEARKQSLEYFNSLRKIEHELAKSNGKKLVNSRGKLTTQEIEESVIFKKMVSELDQLKIKNDELINQQKQNKLNNQNLANKLSKILSITLEESTLSSSKRELYSRKIKLLEDGDLSQIFSIISDLNF